MVENEFSTCEWSESEFVAGKNIYGFSLIIYKNIDKTVRCQRFFFCLIVSILGLENTKKKTFNHNYILSLIH